MSSKNVLLIDDDDNIRTVAQIALEDVAGWSVIAVGSGQEALSILAEVRPDVILLDVMMPIMDGPTTLGRIRSDGHTIPVIFMTAQVRPDELDRHRALGFVGVILKPFDPMTLAEEIERALKG